MNRDSKLKIVPIKHLIGLKKRLVAFRICELWFIYVWMLFHLLRLGNWPYQDVIVHKWYFCRVFVAFLLIIVYVVSVIVEKSAVGLYSHRWRFHGGSIVVCYVTRHLLIWCKLFGLLFLYLVSLCFWFLYSLTTFFKLRIHFEFFFFLHQP